jgi:hypothetical protein
MNEPGLAFTKPLGGPYHESGQYFLVALLKLRPPIEKMIRFVNTTPSSHSFHFPQRDVIGSFSMTSAEAFQQNSEFQSFDQFFLPFLLETKTFFKDFVQEIVYFWAFVIEN